jgi:hypothetical protein
MCHTFVRASIVALGVVLAAAALGRADEYKGATVKGVENGKFVFEVNGKEVRISPGSISWKGFDASGKELTEFGQNFRVMKPGNVVNVTTTRKGRNEFISEIHLVEGQLAEMGKPSVSGKSGSSSTRQPADQKTYKAAVVKSVEGKNVVLVVGDEEMTFMVSGAMQAYDTNGRRLPKGTNMRLLKEGNQVDVTTYKNRGREIIREIHLVRGSLVNQ